MANLNTGTNNQQASQKSNQLTQNMVASNTIGGHAFPPAGGPLGGGMASKCPSCPIVSNSDSQCKNVINDKTRYTCQPGYEGNGEKDEITCNMQGKWEPDPFRFQCQRKMCTNAPTVVNAYVDGPKTVATNQVIKYKCNVGYRSTSTVMTVECEDQTKQFKTPNFKCDKIDCGRQPTLHNGNTQTQLTVHNTQLTYQCNTGYKIENAHGIVCGDDGKWAPSIGAMKCNLVECPALTKPTFPENADVIEGGNYRKWKSTVTYKCKTGFVGNGQTKTARCNAQGSWEPTLADIYKSFKCIRPGCSTPPSVPQATVTGQKSAYAHGESAQYTCGTGYTGSGTATCNSGSWSNPNFSCTIKSCGRLTIFNNLFDVSEGSGYPNYKSTVTFNCKAGYKSNNGHNVITCKADGKWSPSEATVHSGYKCTAKQCPATAPTVTHATATVTSSRTIGSTLTYTCDKYYDLTGTATVTCKKDESWQNPNVQCTLQKCGTAPTISNAKASVTAVVSHGGSVTYTCKDGHRMLKATVTAINCVGKSWDKIPSFTCESTSCDASKIPNVNKATRTPNTSSGTLPHGTTINYNCDKGHYSTSTHDTIKCENAKWTKASFNCVAVTCEGVPEIQNAHADNPSGKSIFNIGNILKYFCDNGKYSNGGDNEIECKNTAGEKHGTWSKTKFKCLNPKSCGAAPTVVNGTPSSTATTHHHNVEVTYTCESCYKATSANALVQKAKCDNGNWDGPKMSCTRISCPNVAVTAAVATAGNFATQGKKSDDDWCGSTAKYTCKTGYTKSSGSPDITCQKSGKWSDINFKCSLVDCGAAPQIPNGIVNTQTTTYNTVASYTCKTGFALRNKQDFTCSAKGNWEPQQHSMKCEASECKQPGHITNTTHNGGSKTVFNEGETVTYTCIDGYTGSGSIKCEGGQWSNANVQCQSKPCQSPQTIPNTVSTAGSSSTFQSGATVTFSCTADYVGSPVKTTCTKGKWSPVSISCKGNILRAMTLHTNPWDCKNYTNSKNSAKFVFKGEKGNCTAYLKNIKHNSSNTIDITNYCTKPIGKVLEVHTSHVSGMGFRYTKIIVCDKGNNCYMFLCGFTNTEFSSCVINNNNNTWGRLNMTKKTEWGTKGHSINATVYNSSLHVVYTWTSLQYGAESKGLYMIRFIDRSGNETEWYTMNSLGRPLMGWNCPCQNYYCRYYRYRKYYRYRGYSRYYYYYRMYYNTREFRCGEVYKRGSYLYHKNTKKSTPVPIQAFWFNLPDGFKIASIEIAPDKDMKKLGASYRGYNDGWYFHGVTVVSIMSGYRFNFACGVDKIHRFCALDFDRSYNFAMQSVVMHDIPTASIRDGKIATITTYTSSLSNKNNIRLSFTDKSGIECKVQSFNNQTTGNRTLVRSRTQDFHITCPKKMSTPVKIELQNTFDHDYEPWGFYKICITPTNYYPKVFTCFTCGTYYSPCRLLNRTKTLPNPFVQNYKIETLTHYRVSTTSIQVELTDYARTKCVVPTMNMINNKRKNLSGRQTWIVKCVTQGQKMGKIRYIKFSNRRTARKKSGWWFMLKATFFSKHKSRYGRAKKCSKTFPRYGRVRYYIFYGTFTIYC
ncbi:sushi, von Willebrand factor type A, EGF and pentraxin domain-containing protein 1-like [Lineus longissimus]|uniref:sushi, von Willebrand factor type A, EGF and pentraxin domain-containing protein 1-like n=1 Tax=Lineus longissimus TaxID=88925 RepID=UPI00315CC831